MSVYFPERVAFSLLVDLALMRGERASSGQTKLCRPYLSFDRLELSDLSFGLAASPDFSHRLDASGFWTRDNSSATKSYLVAEEFPDADGV